MQRSARQAPPAAPKSPGYTRGPSRANRIVGMLLGNPRGRKGASDDASGVSPIDQVLGACVAHERRTRGGRPRYGAEWFTLPPGHEGNTGSWVVLREEDCQAPEAPAPGWTTGAYPDDRPCLNSSAFPSAAASGFPRHVAHRQRRPSPARSYHGSIIFLCGWDRPTLATQQGRAAIPAQNVAVPDARVVIRSGDCGDRPTADGPTTSRLATPTPFAIARMRLTTTAQGPRGGAALDATASRPSLRR
jgi:hypothetical protein